MTGRRLVDVVGLGIGYVVVATAANLVLGVLVTRYSGGTVGWTTYAASVLLWQAFFSSFAFAVLASVTFGLATAASLREEGARRSEAELLRARSELKALRAQLNPHFLFNTLHSVRALIRENPGTAEDALEQLGDLLRYSLRIQDAADDGVLLREEWEFVRAYLALEKLRLGERLRVEEEASEAALQSVVPAFVLQPLVENAIRHGIAVRERGGTVRLRARLEGDALSLQVQDDGPGANGHATRGTGKGLELVRQRLSALYGAAGSVEVSSSPGSGFSVVVRLSGAPEWP
jgi:LytS/YehU family sensor histidine kinase